MAPARQYRNFILEPQRRFVFAYVAKVACTNWKAIMRYLAGYPDYLDPRLAHDRTVNGLTFLDLAADGFEVLADPGIPVYTCVRDPYTRVLSAYLDKVDRRLGLLDDPGAPQGDHFMQVTRDVDAFRREQLDPEAYPAVTFEVFMLWLRDARSRFRGDEHWQTQTVLLRWPKVAFDDIGRFETLDVDSARLLGKMGCDIGFPSQGDVRFPATEAAKRLESHLTPLARSLVAEFYREDFSNFGYAI